MNIFPKAAAVLFVITFLFSACQKIELEDNDNERKEDNKTEKPSTDQETPIDGDTLNISTALSLNITSDTLVILKGYIVGYIKGTSLDKSVFSLPEQQGNTNMLLADRPEENDATQCLPVALEKDGALNVRAQLNLFDNPELFHQKIAIYGALTTYFRVRGVKKVYNFEILEEKQTEKPDESTEPNWPQIDHNPETNPGGR